MHIHKQLPLYDLQTGDQEECLWVLSWHPSLSSVRPHQGNPPSQSKEQKLEAQQQEHQDLINKQEHVTPNNDGTIVCEMHTERLAHCTQYLFH